MIIPGYKEVKIGAIKDLLTKRLVETKDITKVDIASSIGTTSQTIDNAFITYVPSSKNKVETFKASDRVLHQVAKALGVDLAIVEYGKKMYFIKK